MGLTMKDPWDHLRDQLEQERERLSEILEAIERRDISVQDVKSFLEEMTKKLADLRKSARVLRGLVTTRQDIIPPR